MQQVTLRTLQTKAHPEAKMTFWFVFGSSRGGPTRCRILKLLQKRPYNTNQIAQELSLDYKSITHNLRVLEKNNMVQKFNAGYGAIYDMSVLFTENQEIFDEISAKLGY